MRVSRQIATVAVLGGLVYAGWANWSDVAPKLAELPGLGFLAPKQGKAGAAPAPGRGGPAGAVLVEVGTVEATTVQEVTEAVGNTRAYESVQLTAKASGIIERISFTEGQTVQAGDELVRLDTAERLADLEAARAAINTTKAQRSETLQKYERAVALRKAGAGTEALVADLTLQLRTAETAIAAAEARERSAAARLDDFILRAPFAGRVGFRNVSLGAMVDNKVIVTTLDDVSRIRLDFAVPETLISRLKVGSAVNAASGAFADTRFPGTVSVIDTRIDPVTRSAKLSAVLANPEGLLKPGMFMNVALQVAVRENALVVPEEAIVSEGPRQIIFAVKDGKVERRIVRIGQRQSGKIEVVEGVTLGEMIVVRGVQRVRNGMAVQTKPVRADVAPAAASPQPEKRA